MLSVIIITKNEEAKIRECLQSVNWADEIVVVDSNSEDNTIDICREFTDIVRISEWSGFGPQKNKALELASHQWILSLDADERVTDSLRREILSRIQSDDFDAYRIPRSSSFCGRYMRHSDWHPDYVLRLFRRGTAIFSSDLVHEKILTDGSVDQLRNPLLHISVETYQQAIDKMNFYSSLWAQDKYAQGKRSSLWKAITHGLATFLKTFILKRGFLDGKEGFALSIANAEGAFYKYLKLAQLYSN